MSFSASVTEIFANIIGFSSVSFSMGGPISVAMVVVVITPSSGSFSISCLVSFVVVMIVVGGDILEI